ncbi:JmjC domain protein [Penicillium malachiteum]|nr:JmjC domain protein [Penicillium malachiteum]
MGPPPRARFEPFPVDLDINEIVKNTPNFSYAPRILCDSINSQPKHVFEELVRLNVVMKGIPLVIEGYQSHLNQHLFSRLFLQRSDRRENVRDLVKKESKPMSVSHYVRCLPTLTRPHFRRTERPQRLYLKDIDCPAEWQESLKSLLPPSLFYMNEGPHPYSGPGSDPAPGPDTPTYLETEGQDGKPGNLIARAGDLMSCLPEEMRAQNLMCYIGHEGTYTPAHQEMCASLGHNIMVESSQGNMENGEPTKPGSSIWLMTETKERQVVSEYWSSMLGHNLDIEDYFAQMKAWQAAPFHTYVVEQRPGDLILVPPLAAHQVWNRGTRTMKVAWNRTTVETLKMALDDALPSARMICRDEQYKNKAIIYYALNHYSGLLKNKASLQHSEVVNLWKDFENLFSLYTDILLSESLSPALEPAKDDIELIKFEGNVVCSYCRCNIFNRFLTCPSCPVGEDDSYDICLDCYVLGRSCKCISGLRWVEQFSWEELRSKHESWRKQIIAMAKEIDSKSRKDQHVPLLSARSMLKWKPIAEICQIQLKIRPWVDINAPESSPKGKSKSTSPSSDGDDSDDDGPQTRKRRKLRNGNKEQGMDSCHMCRNIIPSWKLAACSGCNLKYCYAVLFCAFDIQPEEAMGQSHWLCPRCEKRCNCTPCQRDPAMKPHEPKHILLGHDTRKIADPRSVESLVNLRMSNWRWIPNLEASSARRLQQRLADIETKRLETWKENDILMSQTSSGMGEEGGDGSAGITEHPDAIPVDPSLLTLPYTGPLEEEEHAVGNESTVS